MGTFQKTTTTKGKFKNIIACEDGTFMDDESGELIDLVTILHEKYGNSPFELVTSLKEDEDI